MVFFLFTDPFEQMVFSEVCSVFREEEGVDAAVGSGGTEGLLLQMQVPYLFRKQNPLQQEAGSEEPAEKGDPSGSGPVNTIYLVFLFQLFPNLGQYCVKLVFPDFKSLFRPVGQN
jgi:hypothetical protein